MNVNRKREIENQISREYCFDASVPFTVIGKLASLAVNYGVSLKTLSCISIVHFDHFIIRT